MRVFTGLLILGLLAVATTVSAEEPTPTISLSATGTVQAQPDRGYISLGVVTKANTSTKAAALNAVSMSELHKSLDDLGITKENIRTTEYSVRQVYRTVRTPVELDNGPTNRQQWTTKQVPDGFQVSNMVQVTVCELGDFGKVLDAAVSDGANSVRSISFGSSKATELTDQARAAAVKRLTTKVKIYTSGLGIELGKVISVREQQQSYGRNKMYARSSALSDGVPETAVSGGSLSFSATVTVTWSLASDPIDDGFKKVENILKKGKALRFGNE